MFLLTLYKCDKFCVDCIYLVTKIFQFIQNLLHANLFKKSQDESKIRRFIISLLPR